MDDSRYSLAAVAFLCVLAIGMSATTLESTVTTDPADEIDVDWDRVPIGQDTAADLRDDIQGDQSDDDESVGTEGGGDPSSQNEATDTGTGEAGTSPRSDLWLALLAVLRVLIPGLGVLLLAAVAYRYRDRLLGHIGQEPTAGRQEPVEEGSWPTRDPSTEVDRAWVTMVKRVGPEQPGTMTPAECAKAAREAGLDEEGVALVTSAFKRVHYGGESPEALAESARTGRQRLKTDAEPTEGAGTDGSTRGAHT